MDSPGQDFQGVPVGRLPGLAFGFSFDAGGDVQQPAAGLDLVPVLAALAGPGEPGDGEVGFLQVLVLDGAGLLYGNRDGGGVDPAAPLRRRRALEPVAAGFVQPMRRQSVDEEAEITKRFLIDTVLSATQVAAAGVDVRQDAHQEPGVFAALGGPDFDDRLHGLGP